VTGLSEQDATHANSTVDPKLVRLPRLDGIRALAVLLVLFFHGGFSWAGGGFFGVDVFFVLSGFLITGLLLSEFAQTATLRLGRFWVHRIRRLMPALLALLVVVGLWAEFCAPSNSLHQTRVDALSSLFYVNNWNLAHGTQGYFAALSSAIPRPLLHTWSLSIEEQFYLIWPVVVLIVLKLTRSLRLLFAIALTGAVASAVEMALLIHGGVNQARVYYGTDTRSQAVLIGAALAVLLSHPLRKVTDRPQRVTLSLVRPIALSPIAKRLLSLAGALSFLGLLLLATQVNDQTVWFYHGGFFLFSVITAVLIASVVLLPEARWASFLELRPVRYIGAISYGLYLWHWPLFLFLNHGRTGLSGVALFTLRVACTFLVAALSLKFLEMPIRRGSLRGLPAAGVLVGSILLIASLLIAATAEGSVTSQSASSRQLERLIAAANSHDSAAYTNDGMQALVPTMGPAGTGPERLLVLGDSEAAFLSAGLDGVASHAGLAYAQDGVMGCGFLNSPSRLSGTLHSGNAGLRGSAPDIVPCTTQLTRWVADVDAFHPDVILVVNGSMEVRDHAQNGRWVNILNPEFSRLERQEIQASVTALKPSGATIVLTTAPYYHQPEQLDGSPWPEDDPARVRTYNRIVEEIAAANAPQVKVLDINKILDPTGVFAPTFQGAPYFMDDGIHLNSTGATLLSKQIIPQLSEWAQQSRAARLSGPSDH